jgi:hypothetical protein
MTDTLVMMDYYVDFIWSLDIPCWILDIEINPLQDLKAHKNGITHGSQHRKRLHHCRD